MTIIKQTGVQSSGHMKNLRGYINDDRKVILRDSLNMDGCTNPKRWAHHMWMTREAYGHNKAARRVRDKKTGELKEAKNTILFHQILGFNPDECDLNGGRLSPEECMRYAKEYVGKHYPNQQIVMALHNEYCKADKTHRYAVHMVINRSDIQTKKRLNEGRGQKAKVERASRIRKMLGEDARVVVEPIRGCTTAVTVLVPGQDRMEHGRYALARLGENTLEWLFPGQLQGLELRQLELTPDLTRAVFLARVEDGDGFYEAPYLCDGQQLVDLARSCAGETPRGAVGVRWDGDDILLFLSDSWTKDTEARTDVYLYHGGRWEQTVCDAPLYVQARQEDGIQFHYGSRYATRLVDGRLCVVDLRSGAVEDTGIPAQADYTVYQQDGELVILTQPE